jgi:hypothetical protein
LCTTAHKGRFRFADPLQVKKNTFVCKKNEAVPPQHYLSPNQIKPNYSFAYLLSVDKGKMLCVNPTTRKGNFLKKILSPIRKRLRKAPECVKYANRQFCKNDNFTKHILKHGKCKPVFGT